MMFIVEIILTFIRVGALCFGGAYASFGVVEKEIVLGKGWLSFQEFFDLMAIDEITPGPIIVNAATFIGTKVAGVVGAIAATFGSILLPCVISLILIIVYKKYKNLDLLSDILGVLKCMAFALILSTTITIIRNALFKEGIILFSNINVFILLMAIAAFIIIRKFKIYPIIVMLACGVLNILINLI